MYFRTLEKKDLRIVVERQTCKLGESADFVEGVVHLADREAIELELDKGGKSRIRPQIELGDAALRQMEEDELLPLFLHENLERSRTGGGGGGIGDDGTEESGRDVGEEQPEWIDNEKIEVIHIYMREQQLVRQKQKDR